MHRPLPTVAGAYYSRVAASSNVQGACDGVSLAAAPVRGSDEQELLGIKHVARCPRTWVCFPRYDLCVSTAGRVVGQRGWVGEPRAEDVWKGFSRPSSVDD